ncbi:unnamed protein product, partial [Amoebophrya sp. A25]
PQLHSSKEGLPYFYRNNTTTQLGKSNIPTEVPARKERQKTNNAA